MKIIFLLLGLLIAGFAPHAFAQGFVPLAPIPDLTQGVVANSAGLASFFNNLYKYLIGLAAALAVIMIIWHGIEIALNKEDVSKLMDSKGKIYNAIFGLVLVLSPVLVFSIINPSILNLSLNLPELQTSSAPASNTTAANNVVCSGYSQYRSAEIMPPKSYCVDEFGGGWVNLNPVCCNTTGATDANYACCGLNASYTAPVTAAPISIP